MSARKSNPSEAGSAGAPQPSFEAQLADLEEIVRQLEAGEKPLDESLALYERGVAALKACHGVLDRAEKRIRVLVKHAGGEPHLEEADPAPEDETEGEPDEATVDTGEAAEGRAKRPVEAREDSEKRRSRRRAPRTEPDAGAQPSEGASLFGGP